MLQKHQQFTRPRLFGLHEDQHIHMQSLPVHYEEEVQHEDALRLQAQDPRGKRYLAKDVFIQ